MTGQEKFSFDDFVEIVRQLREKCPWDKVQTHESLKKCLADEAQEALEGIDIHTASGDGANLCEELGDLLMQIVLHSIIAEEEGIFTLEDVVDGISRKMRFRHPRIFSPDDPEMASLSWSELKAQEKELREKFNVAGP